ncbi:PREDICTED: L-type lectin-domain containing receptor kinase IX.1-like [Prunus mume]|uniref:L-type lectin-domain containing receptor kinase IX.1-like n=1 Tax=Prunus mume TaxID=102107 RepID=A0ABM1LLF5_PRUMU|nr:PREDICTED: L-type lectin-domain containing receptor kinase IX.1-like [Prunus mume]
MVILLLLLLFHLAPCATSLNFSFPTFPNGINTLSLEGDAFVDGDFLRLTKSAADDVQDQSVGRATYSQPFLLRDNATGKLADFTTNFTFAIDSLDKTPYADGLAFFLAPNGSALNRTIGRGGSLGLPVINPEKNESTNLYPFVAVEFDIYSNNVTSVEDPAGDHVGIDVNSVKSKVTRAWNGSITKGRLNNAWIRYDSGSKNLSVTFTTYENGVWVRRYFDYMVDVNEILQGWVIVGFSAATGAMTALHKINSWSFNSTSLIDENANNNTPVAPEPTPIVEPGSGNGINIGLVVGLVVGGCVLLVGGFCLVWFIFWKKGGTGESSDNDEDPMINDPIDDEFEKGTGPKKFSYKMLAQSTNDFDEGEKLGEGGFGGVYRDFGLARLVDHGKQSQTTILAGTMGYMAPECVTTGKASKETDVYSFGVVALEIACGRKPIDPKLGTSKINMVEWVWELYGQGKVIEAADPKLCGDFDEKQIECLLIVGLWCAHPDYKIRPSTQQIIQVLSLEVAPPILPSKMPVASYFSPPVSFSILSGDVTGSERGQTESSSYGYNTNSSQFTSSSASNSTPSASLLYTN